MAENNIELIIRNIKALQKMKGLTNEKFAFDLGYDNKSSLTNKIYDKSISKIDDDLLLKIANYFGISLKELKTEDLSFIEELTFNDFTVPFQDLAFQSMNYKMFPILSTKNALSNINFRRAFSIHNKLYERLENDINKLSYDSKVDYRLNEMFSYYDKAIKEELVEAAVNQLSLIGLYWLGIVIGDSILELDENDEYVNLFKNRELNFFSSKSFLLKALNSKKGKEGSRNFIDRHNGYMTHLMRMIQRSKKYYEYAYFFFALRYQLCILDERLTNYTVDETMSIGSQLMEYFALIGNKYAKEYLSIFDTEE